MDRNRKVLKLSNNRSSQINSQLYFISEQPNKNINRLKKHKFGRELDGKMKVKKNP